MSFCTTHFRTYPAEHSGCITCYQEKAKISTSKARKEQKQANVLAKGKSSKNKPIAIPQISKKQASINAKLAKIKKQLTLENPICFTCKEVKGVTLSHIITAKNKKWETERENLVLECRLCHSTWEDKKAVYYSLFPAEYRQKLERIKPLSTEHYYKLLDKIQ